MGISTLVWLIHLKRFHPPRETLIPDKNSLGQAAEKILSLVSAPQPTPAQHRLC